jgi:hypothetical protein
MALPFLCTFQTVIFNFYSHKILWTCVTNNSVGSKKLLFLASCNSCFSILSFYDTLQMVMFER